MGNQASGLRPYCKRTAEIEPLCNHVVSIQYSATASPGEVANELGADEQFFVTVTPTFVGHSSIFILCTPYSLH